MLINVFLLLKALYQTKFSRDEKLYSHFSLFKYSAIGLKIFTRCVKKNENSYDGKIRTSATILQGS
jgi:hypothetical protein